jgi:fatty acid desaturase
MVSVVSDTGPSASRNGNLASKAPRLRGWQGRGDVRHLVWNLALAAVTGIANLFLFLLIPWWLLPQSSWWLLLLVPIVLLTVTHWALVHEAIHANLHPRKLVNNLLGRALAILFGAPFRILRFGHLSHHSLNGRASERPELYREGEGPRWRIVAVYYARLLVGLYGAEVASGPLSLLPRRLLRPMVRTAFYDGRPDARGMADRAERDLLAPEHLRQARNEALLIMALLGTSFALYASAWPWLLATLIGRGCIVSFMDNAPHYGGVIGDPAQGYDMRAPRPLDRLILNSNLHGTHHRHPNLAWTELPQAFALERDGYDGSWLLMPLRQLGGPMPVGEVKPRRPADAP